MTNALRLTQDELTNLQARIAGVPRDQAYAQRREVKAARSKQKYGNQRIEIDGIAFDSKAEARYWRHLVLREKAREVSNIRRQVVFELAPAVVIGGRKRPPLRYIADFVYDEAGQTIVADVKGVAPDSYRIKRHLMKSVHGIDIMEIRS